MLYLSLNLLTVWNVSRVCSTEYNWKIASSDHLSWKLRLCKGGLLVRCTLRRNCSRKRSILADGDEIPTLCKTKNQQISRESHLPRALNSKKRCKPEDTEEEAFCSKNIKCHTKYCPYQKINPLVHEPRMSLDMHIHLDPLRPQTSDTGGQGD